MLSPHLRLLILPRCIYNCNRLHIHTTSTLYKSPPRWNVLFFGTDDFSNYSLQTLCKEYENRSTIARLEVVTNVKGKPNPVQTFSDKHKLKVHSWPVILKDNEYDVGLVVSFGHLIPENVIRKFPLGMLNVHASLLPRWRGAAPIIHAIANGDTKTGVTVMKIEPNHFDVGGIVAQEKVQIDSDMKMPELHQKLGNLGAKILLEVIQKLPESLKNIRLQSQEGITYAPKVTPSFSQINWSKMTSIQIYNLERALTKVYPISTSWNEIPVKLLEIQCSEFDFKDISKVEPGFIIYDKNSKTLKVLCADLKWISVKKIGVLGKKIMNAADFNNGYIRKVEIKVRYFK